MKFVADRAELKGKLAQVAHGVARGYTTLPVLSHVLLKAQGDRLQLRTTNLETAVETSMAVTVEEEGACTVLHEPLLKWLGAPLLKDTVTITYPSKTRGGTICLRAQCGRNSTGHKDVYSEDEMPVARHAPVAAIVSAVDLIEAIQAVGWAAASGDEANRHPERAGVLMELREDEIRLVALDGIVAIALYDAPARSSRSGDSVVVNGRSMEAVAKLVSGDVRICVGEGFVSFKTDDAVITGTTLEGAFPNYEPHFAEAEKGDKVWTVSKAEIKRLLKAVGPFAQGGYTSPRVIEIELSDVRKAVTVDGETVDVGDCMGTMRASGKGAIAFHVSPVFIKKAVDSIVGDELTFVLRDPKQSLFLKPSVGDQSVLSAARHKIVMMPMTVTRPAQAEPREEANEP